MKEFLGKIRPPKNHILFQSKCLSPLVSCFLEFLQVFSKYLDYRKANLPALLHLIDRAVDLHNLLENQHPDVLLQCVLLFIAQPLLGLTSMFLPFLREWYQATTYTSILQQDFFRRAMPLSGWHLRQYPLSSHFCVGMQKVQGRLLYSCPPGLQGYC